MILSLLDTMVLAAYLLGRPKAVALVDPWIDADGVATSIIAYAEAAEYLVSFRDAARYLGALEQLMTISIEPLPITRAIARRYATLRRQLRSPHGPGLIGDMDTLIAA